MTQYFYTFKNDFGVLDVGQIEAVSDRDFRDKLADLPIRPIWSYTEQAYKGHEYLFRKFTKKRFRTIREKNETLQLSGSRYFIICCLLFSMIIIGIVWLKAGLWIMPLIIMLLAGLIAVLHISLVYKMDVDPGKKQIILKRKILFWQYQSKCIDVSDAIEIELESKIAAQYKHLYIKFVAAGYEKLFVVKIKSAGASIAIDSSSDEKFEYRMAESISKLLSLPLTMLDKTKTEVN